MPPPMTCRFSAAQRARAALTDAIGSRITLQPDESGKFLWAEFGLETVLFANITAWPLFTCDDLVRQSRRPVHSFCIAPFRRWGGGVTWGRPLTTRRSERAVGSFGEVTMSRSEIRCLRATPAMPCVAHRNR